MSVGFVFTNFNNSLLTKKAVESIFACRNVDDAYVVIVDNKSEDDDLNVLKHIDSQFSRVKIIYNNENIGYFKGLNIGIEYLRRGFSDVEVIVVGNNDLTFSSDFIDQLQHYNNFGSYGVISPDIINMDGEHQNPHVISNISTIREFIWDLYYLNYSLARLITYIAGISRRFTQRKDFQEFDIPRRIAQGYGACYILGPLFFHYFETLWAPTFLMGEEFFLTEQLSWKGLYVFYEPNLKVYHHDHATMGKLPGKKLWKYAKDAHKVYRQFVRPFWVLRSNDYSNIPEGK